MGAVIEYSPTFALPQIKTFNLNHSPSDRIKYLTIKINQYLADACDHDNIGDTQYSNKLFDLIDAMESERDFLKNLTIIFWGQTRCK